VELSKTAEEVYKQQKEQIASSRAVGDTTGAGATGKTVETVFSIEGQNYNPLTFLDLEPLKEKYLPEGWPGRIDEYEFQWITQKKPCVENRVVLLCEL